MTALKYFLLGFAVLLVNNILLLWFIGHSSKDSSFSSAINPFEGLDSASAWSDGEGHTGSVPGFSSAAAAFDNHNAKSQNNADLVRDNVREYLSSQEFLDILDKNQTRTWVNLQSRRRELSQMTGGQLLSEYYEAETTEEKTIILDFLNRADMDTLDVVELKGLYNDLIQGQQLDLIKPGLLINLLDKGDWEALEWSKQLLQSGSELSVYANDFHKRVYEQDPQFFLEWVSDLSLDEYSKYRSLGYLVAHDQKLVDGFMQNSLDELLNSDNLDWFKAVGPISRNVNQLELSSYQQQRLAELFSSEQSLIRDFAMDLVQSMDESRHLRTAFYSLDSSIEERNFLMTMEIYGDEDIKELFYELAEDSDDPMIRSFLIPD